MTDGRIENFDKAWKEKTSQDVPDWLKAEANKTADSENKQNKH